MNALVGLMMLSAAVAGPLDVAEAHLHLLYAEQTDAMKRADVPTEIMLSKEIDLATYQVIVMRRQKIQQFDHQLSGK